MVKAWLIFIAAKLQAWSIPESVLQNLSTLTMNAESALESAKNESTRAPVATAQCKESFDADPANKGYRIWYSVLTPGVVPSTDPQDLRESFFTHRKKDVVRFNDGDNGKTAYFAVQGEKELL
jgi:hypothetical protein